MQFVSHLHFKFNKIVSVVFLSRLLEKYLIAWIFNIGLIKFLAFYFINYGN